MNNTDTKSNKTTQQTQSTIVSQSILPLVETPAVSANDATAQPKQQRIGSKQRRLEFGDYKANFLAPVKIVDRHSLNISNATWERLERVARILGDRGANVGSYAERILSEHLNAYSDDIEAWRKL